MIKVTICGVCGKMGKRIATLVSRDKELSIAGATEIKGCSLLGVSLGKELQSKNIGVMITDSLKEAVKDSDVVIDFTIPDATMQNLKICVENRKPIVIGTTGFTDEQISAINEASKTIPVFFSPNMSVGVNLVFDILGRLAKGLGEEYKVQMEEAHHIHKKDKPSGTAKMMAKVIMGIRKDLKDISINSIREGEIIGDHKVVFDSDVDTIEIVHKAKTRDIFVKGAIAGAKFLTKKTKGLYTMKDVLEEI